MPRQKKPFQSNPELATAYWELYQQGASCTEIAKIYGNNRNSVWELLKAYGYKLRTKKSLAFIVFNGSKYTLKPSGYYARTNGERTLLHRDVWSYHNGSIPSGCDIHHINSNKQDNRIQNLACLPKGEHTKHHEPGKEFRFSQGQSPKLKSVKRCDTGEIYISIKAAAAAAGVSPSSISNSAKKGHKSARTYWEWV